MTKIGLISLGCPKNEVDAEMILGQLSDEYEITADEAEAEIIIINTCGFIRSAKEESIRAILEAGEMKKTGKCKGIIVTGCLAERYPKEIKKDLPEADAILGIGQYGRISEAIERISKGERYENTEEDLSLDYLNGKREITTSGASAYLKIAEGCDNRCSYCAIPGIRGPYRSRKAEDIITEAKRLLLKGIKEIILVAQDTSRYGKDIYGKPSLAELLQRLDEIPGMCRIRIMYLYPDEVSAELIDTISRSKHILHYVDLPVQHVSDRMLRLMNRRGTGSEIRDIFSRFKKAMPDCVIRSTLMTGFPGEREEDFEEMMSFIEETGFDRLGVFEFSREENTPAWNMKDPVPAKVKHRRYKALMSLQQKISREKNKERVGKVYETITEGIAEDGIFYYGRTYAEAPEVDGYVYFTSEEPLTPGELVNVKILVAEEYDLTGEVV